jgi:hypothetical protein
MGTEKYKLISIALLHYLIKKRDGELGFTSITNLDIHDIARLSRTFGIGKYYVVSPVESQQNHALDVVKHWTEGYGSTYNSFRKDAMELVAVIDTLDSVIDDVTKRFDKEPIIVGTAAQNISNKTIDYSTLCDKILSADCPIVLVFGTGWGLHEEAVNKCDYFLEPIVGTGEYNHLSVRSAVTIVVDRLINKIKEYSI